MNGRVLPGSSFLIMLNFDHYDNVGIVPVVVTSSSIRYVDFGIKGSYRGVLSNGHTVHSPQDFLEYYYGRKKYTTTFIEAYTEMTKAYMKTWIEKKFP